MSTEHHRPRVSLVISVWNRKDDLRENLASIRAQTVPADQVIVVDNDSSDGTPEMVTEEFPEVQLIRMPSSDYGACETFNVGFASAKGDFETAPETAQPDVLKVCVTFGAKPYNVVNQASST